MTRKDGDDRFVGAVEKSFTIVEHLVDCHSAGISEIARAVGLPKSTVTVHLQTLLELGYVVKNDDGTYRASLRFLEHGGQIRNHIDLYHAARAQVDELSTRVGEVATIGYEEADQRVLLYRTEPIEGLSDNAPVGQFTQMHWTALGKALLAQKSDEEIAAVVDSFGLPKATDHTITDREELMAEVERIRERGYSVEDEEHVEGIRSVAVPLDVEGVAAAISIAGPKYRLTDERIRDELVEALQESANIIALKYQHY